MSRMQEIENRVGSTLMSMALVQLFDMGVENALGIIDADIKETEGNVFMTKDRVESLLMTVREIAGLSLQKEIIPYITSKYGESFEDYKQVNKYKNIAAGAIDGALSDADFDEVSLRLLLGVNEDDFKELLEMI